MDKKTNKDNFEFWDILLPGGLLFLSYLVLFLLPQQESWKFWIAFAVSAFLFCIGYFPLIALLPEPESKTGSVIKSLLLMALGMGAFFFCLYYVYIENGSSRSLAAATLLLIESIVMCSLAGGGPVDTSRLPKILFWVIIIGMAAVGCWFIVREFTCEAQEGYGGVEVAGMLWIAALSWWMSLPISGDSKIYKRKKKNSSGK